MSVLEVDINARALIFDLDGTLADSMPVHYMAWRVITDRHGISFPEGLFYEWAGFPSPKIAQLLMKKDLIDSDVQVMAEEKENTYLEMIHLVKPVIPVVDIVKKYAGILPIGAGTGSPRKFALLSLRALGIMDYFQAIVSFEEVEHPKPAPDTFLRCAALLKVEPPYCQVFEDGDPGLIAARAAGMIVTDIRPFL